MSTQTSFPIADAGMLRVITCGSVDDGKSTLLGRMLFDLGQLHDDQLAALARDSRRHGTVGQDMDYALLLDGLDAEREQGITIDVAYRYFNAGGRRIVVADCPGHEQYTRNMATGASTADLAVVLVDASRGLLPQTRRHSYVCALMGIRQVVLAVNKMDLVDHAEAHFETIAQAYRGLAHALAIETVHCIPVVARAGHNLVRRAACMDWYRGPTLVEVLQSAPGAAVAPDAPARMPVQWVVRPDSGFRGFAGTVAAGSLHAGQAVRVLPAGTVSRIARLVRHGGDPAGVAAGEAVVVTLTDEVDASRGDMLVAADAQPPEVADQFAAHVVWMAEEPLLPGRPYLLKAGARTLRAQVTEIKHRIDVDTQERLAAKRLALNEIGLCNLSLDAPLVFEPYRDNRVLGGFILIDRHSNETVAAGVIAHALRRAGNIAWQALDVDKAARARAKRQRPRCLWFTGLSGSGKSTLANLVERRLHAQGHHTYLLDGDNVRHGLNRDLGFSDEDRVENIRRVAEVARLMVDAGLIVLVAFISPFRAEREMARALFEPGEFVEVFVDAPLAVCEARDPKGLYRRARSGAIPNFTGIGSAYEPPAAPELRLRTAEAGAESLAGLLIDYLQREAE